MGRRCFGFARRAPVALTERPGARARSMSETEIDLDYARKTLEAIVDNRVRGAEKGLALACLRGLGQR